MSKRKRIVLISIVLLVLSGGVVAWLQLRQLKTNTRQVLEAIPDNAFCLISSQNIRETWGRMSRGNLIWGELGGLEWTRSVSTAASAVDSLLNTEPDLADYLNGGTCWFSLHATGNDRIDYIVGISADEVSGGDYAEQLIRKAAGKTPLIESRYGVATLLKHPKWCAGWAEGILLLSGNPELLKLGFDQLASRRSILNDPAFRAVQQTAGKNPAANIYLHLPRLSTSLQRISDQVFKDRVEDLSRFGSWIELDATLRPNQLLLNGYTSANDSAGHFLSAFQGQQPQRVEVAAVLPANTLLYVDYGISNFEQFMERYDAMLERQNMANQRRDAIAQLNTQYGLDPGKDFGSWLGNEICHALVSSPDGTIEPYALLSTGNTEQARNQLAKLGGDSMITDSSGLSIYTLRANKLLPTLLGPLFNDLQTPVYAFVQHYVVFANHPQALYQLVAAAESGKTLGRNGSYVDFVSNLADEASLTVYTAGGQCLELMRKHASESFATSLLGNTVLLQKFDGFMFRMSTTDQNLFYTSALLRHNPQSKQLISSLWETALDTTISSRPQLLINHNTQGLDVFVQDDANTIYLISSTGKIFWKKALDSRIIGEVQQVDALKNGKLQIIFNTANAIHVIDRNGNTLAPFPVQLPSKATASLRVFDYDNDLSYRLMVACQDKSVYNYTIKGVRVEGWKFSGSADVVTTSAQHCVVGGKDYIVWVDRSGKIYIVDRQGNIRLQLRERLPSPVYFFALEPGLDLSKTYLIAADSLGNVTRISFTDNLERLHFMDFTDAPKFNYADINGDGTREYLFVDAYHLMVFDQDKKPILTQSFESKTAERIQLFTFSENDIRLGVTCPEANQVYLFNSSGKASSGSPLSGKTAFSIGKLNGPSSFTLVCAKEQYLYAYPIQ